MKVGIFVPTLNPMSGGSYTFQAQILQSIAAHAAHGKHDFIFYSWNRVQDQNAGGRVRFQKLPWGFLGKALHRLENFFWKTSWVDRFLRNQKIDLMLYPAPSILTYELPFAVVHWDIQHRNSPYFPEVSLGGEWEGREVLHRKMLQRAALIVTGTETGKREIERYYGVNPSLIHVAPLPVPSFVLGQSILSKEVETQIKRYGDYLFYPSQFWPHKNHANLLRALAQLNSEGLILSLILTGSDKGNGDYIRDLARQLGLTDQIHILGFVERNELIALYKGAKAMTFLTLCGPDNLPPLEAFAIGCPVVASDIPGARDQLGTGARFVNPLDPLDIAAGIKAVLSDNDLRAGLLRSSKEKLALCGEENFVNELFAVLDRFECVRRTWP